jgi:hypothetical protein
MTANNYWVSKIVTNLGDNVGVSDGEGDIVGEEGALVMWRLGLLEGCLIIDIKLN